MYIKSLACSTNEVQSSAGFSACGVQSQMVQHGNQIIC